MCGGRSWKRPDSISLLLDRGFVFTGDLVRPDYAPEESAAEVRASWEKILSHPVDWVYPGHGEILLADDIREMLGMGKPDVDSPCP